ncbi:MAG: hypothetical protein H7255_12450 [Ramlibacter sp.]|nr:hypothetical protein [Ramlibacter sp.]
MPAPRELLFDEALIVTLAHMHPALTAPTVHERRSVEVAAFDVVRDVPMGEIFVALLARGQALKCSGLRSGYAICARSRTPTGQTIVGLHPTELVSRTMSPDAAFNQLLPLLEKMVESGATRRDIQIFILGGEVSRFEQSADMRTMPLEAAPLDACDTGTVPEGALLIGAAGHLLAGARIGLCDSEDTASQDELEDLAREGIELKPATGRPEAVSVFVTDTEVFHVRSENDHSVAPQSIGDRDSGGDEGDATDEAADEVATVDEPTDIAMHYTALNPD